MRNTKRNVASPQKLILRFFRWFCRPELRDYIEGDLMELYDERCREDGRGKADVKFVVDVLLLFRPGIIKPVKGFQTVNHYGMFKSYCKVGWRNLTKNKGYSFINIGGLAVGMAVAMVIGLWIYDEVSYNKYHEHYDRIAQVLQNLTYNGEVVTEGGMPYPLAEELRHHYGSDFKYVVAGYGANACVIAYNEKKLLKRGLYMDAQAPELLNLKMLRGTRDGLKDPAAILLSASAAKAFFGDADPMDKLMRMNNRHDVKVMGVYEDLPHNSRFSYLTFIASSEIYHNENQWIRKMENGWNVNFVRLYVQLADHADFNQVSAKIRSIKLNKLPEDEKGIKPALFLHPMKKWHLYDEFKNGVNTEGRIQLVWFFGVVGITVLLLACINFMNLTTARSEKRAKEVGIRKSIGSIRGQLMMQFFSESLVGVCIAFVLCLVLVQLLLPYFNALTDKQISILWTTPLFWLVGVGFCIITGVIAGSYPAFYLSSFHAIHVLKGTFRVGQWASIPRKAMVVVQFTASVMLIIGTIIVFRQIQFAKDRPIGYQHEGLVVVPMFTEDIKRHFDAFREELKSTGAVLEVSESQNPPTEVWTNNTPGLNWRGKDPHVQADFATIGVSHDYGRTVGWQFVEGRDFSRDFPSDSTGFILNEAAVRYMGLKNPVGEVIQWDGSDYKVIGVIKDMVMSSPFQRVKQSIFMIARPHENFAIIRIHPEVKYAEALPAIEKVFKKFAPASPFEYKFGDALYAEKFGDEERVGQLACLFAVLAIFISCLGVFGLASFTAEQRTKEIGIRKVLGASIVNLWKLLSKDFVILVMLSCLIAIPITYYFLQTWLLQYQYRTEILWGDFFVGAWVVLLIVIMTVSFQSVKAAMADPVHSLRSE